jgi:hypothetical protein
MTPSAWRHSLRIRLLAGTLFWVAGTILVAGWGLGTLFRQHVEAQFHAELRTHLDQLTAHILAGCPGAGATGPAAQRAAIWAAVLRLLLAGG